MSNYFEYNDTVVFHPGYYIKEIVDESGLTQSDFAGRLGTTPKTLSVLINGRQAISVDIAGKLSRMLGTSVQYWLNMQNEYDIAIETQRAQMELKREKNTFEHLDYKYLIKHHNLSDYDGDREKQIEASRNLMKISAIYILSTKALMTSYRDKGKLNIDKIVNSNAMMQIAINIAAESEAPKFNRQKFQYEVAQHILRDKSESITIKKWKSILKNTGIILLEMPEMGNCCVKGATKKVDGKLMMMINSSEESEEKKMKSLYEELEYAVHGNFGMSFKSD